MQDLSNQPQDGLQPFRAFQGTDHPLYQGASDLSGNSPFANQKETIALQSKEMERASIIPFYDDIMGWFSDEPKQGNGIIQGLPRPSEPVKPYSICDNAAFALGTPEICGW